MDRNFYAVSFNEDGSLHSADECGPWRIAAWAFGNRQLKQPWAVVTEAEYHRIVMNEMSDFSDYNDGLYFGVVK